MVLTRLIFLASFIFQCLFFYSQNVQVKFQGDISDDKGSISGAQVQVMQGGKMINTITTDGSGKYAFELPLGGDYQVTVSKEGYVSKKFTVNTMGVPPERATTKFPIIQASLGLFKKMEGVDYSALNQPLNKYKYSGEADNFEYDEAYLEQMLAKLESIKAAEKDLIKKEKEKEANYAAAIKLGDKQFNSKDLQGALGSYQEAQRLKPNEAYPANQITAINKAMADAAAKKVADDAAAKAKADAEALAKKQADEAAAKAKADKEAADKLAKEKADAEAKAKADAEAKAKAEKEAADKKAAEEAAAKAKADKEAADKLAKEKADADAKAKAEADAKAKAEKEAADKKAAEEAAAKAKADKEAADKLAKEKAAADAKAKADAEARAKSDKDAADKKAAEEAAAKAKADKEAADRLAKEKADADAKAKADAAAKAKADADALARKEADEAAAKAKADKEAAEKSAREKAEADAKSKADKDAADKLAKEKADADARAKAEADAKAKADKDAADKLAREKADADARAKAEEESKKAQEQDSKYKSVITRADAAFEKNDWPTAKLGYSEAIAMRPKDTYPKNRLGEVEAMMKGNVVKQDQINAKSNGSVLQVLGGDAKYKDAVKRGDELFNTKRYKEAKKSYEDALTYKGGDAYAKGRLVECEKLINSDDNQKTDERIKQLLAKYAPGVTEETITTNNVVITQRVVVRDNMAWVFQKKMFNWGGVAYFRDNLAITESTFEQETKP